MLGGIMVPNSLKLGVWNIFCLLLVSRLTVQASVFTLETRLDSAMMQIDKFRINCSVI